MLAQDWNVYVRNITNQEQMRIHTRLVFVGNVSSPNSGDGIFTLGDVYHTNFFSNRFGNIYVHLHFDVLTLCLWPEV